MLYNDLNQRRVSTKCNDRAADHENELRDELYNNGSGLAILQVDYKLQIVK